MRGMKFKESFCDSVFLKNGMKKGTKRRLKRGLAMLLAFLMLPFSDFVGIGIREVFADTQAESVTVKEDYVLTEDLRVNDLVVEEGTLNLNHHALYVEGNLIQRGGRLELGGGCLSVEGNCEISGTGILSMKDDADRFYVAGDFFMKAGVRNEEIYGGRMEILGDFVQSAGDEEGNFYTSNSFTLYLTGDEVQRLVMEEAGGNRGSRIANLVIENESEEGVILEGSPYVSGRVTSYGNRVTGYLGIGNGTEFTEDYFDGGIEVLSGTGLNSPLRIGESLLMEKEGGNFNIYSNLEIAGDVTVSGNNCGFGIYSDKGYVLVQGNYYQRNGGSQVLAAGVLECRKDVTIEGESGARGNHKVILSGDEEQRVSLFNGASFHILELNNHSREGVVFKTAGAWHSLITNGCKLSVGEIIAEESHVLSEDEAIPGDFVMTGGSWDLNGHTLTVSGNFIHSEGMLSVNGGSLIVQGDYRKQERTICEDGSYLYGGTKSVLNMSEENSYVLVEGDFYDGSTQNGGVYFSRGCMELKGNYYQQEDRRDYTFNACGSSTLLISGDEKQVLHFSGVTDWDTRINNLDIKNISEAGVVFEGAPRVEGSISSERESRIHGCIQLASPSKVSGGYYGGDVLICREVKWENDFEIGGNLCVEDYLKVYSNLTVDGNVYIRDVESGYKQGGSLYGQLYVFQGNLHIKGNLEAESKLSSTGICMMGSSAYALVEGDYRVLDAKFGTSQQEGILEIKGDVDIRRQLYGNSRFKLVLGGDKKQNVFIGDDPRDLVIELKNRSEEGVCLENIFGVSQWILNDCNLTYQGISCMTGYTLTEDTKLSGDVVLIGGIMALNGHKLEITGDLIQMSGRMILGGGTLSVGGSFFMGEFREEAPDEDFASNGTLELYTDEDHIVVGKNFSVNITGLQFGAWSNGVIEVHGDVDFNNGFGGNANATSYFNGLYRLTLLLNGEEKQTVTYHYYEYTKNMCLKNIAIDNQSEGGVVFVNTPQIAGEIVDNPQNHVEGNIKILSTAQLSEGYFGGGLNVEKLIVSGDTRIGGDVIISGNNTISVGHELIIGGNLDLSGTLDIAHGSLQIGGNLTVKDSGKGLKMSNEDDYVLVGGNYLKTSDTTSLMNQGTLEVKGDYTEKYDSSYGNGHRLVLSGEGLQRIQNHGHFHVIELNNHSSEGVFSKRRLDVDQLILNGCKLTIGDEESISGFTLNEDYVAAGDLYLVDGTLDLNGYTLTVQGDLILQEGEIVFHHGSLIVEGNFRQQTRDKTEDGYEYSESFGHLYMDEADDYLCVKKDSYFMPPSDGVGNIKGTIELLGNLETDGGTALSLDGDLVFSGKEKQKIGGGKWITTNNLIISNESLEGVEFAAYVRVNGTVDDSLWKAGGNGGVCIRDFGQLKDGAFGGNVTFGAYTAYDSNIKLQNDLDIRGTLLFDYYGGSVNIIRCGNHTISVGKLILNSNLYVEEAKLYIAGDLLVQWSGSLNMDKEEGRLSVNGDVLFCGRNVSYLSEGVMELAGNFTQQYSERNFMAAGNHKTILKGGPEGRGGDIQRVHFDAPSLNRFHILVLTNDLYTNYEFDTVPEEIADEVVYLSAAIVYPRPVTEIIATEVTAYGVTLEFDGTWTDGEAAGFEIYRDGVRVGTTGMRSYRDTGLNGGQTYTYTVYSYNGDRICAKESPSLQITTSADMEPPEKIKNLQVTERTGSTITLSWDKGRDNVGVEKYYLYRNGKLVYEGGAENYEDKGLEEKTVYTYYVIAEDGSENRSEKSDETDGVVFVPEIISVTPEDYGVIGGEQISLEVTFSGEGKSSGNSVKIEYYDTDYLEWRPVTKTALGQKETGVEIHRVSCVWNLSALNQDRDVDVRFTLKDRAGNSSEKIVTYTVDREPPYAPENVEVMDIGGTIIISWDKGGSADCEGYELYRKQEGMEDYLVADISGKNSTWYEDDSMTEGVEYRYYVRAYDAFHQLSEPAESPTITVAADTKAPRVTLVTPDPGRVGGITSLTLEGKDNRGVSRFLLHIRQNGEEEWKELATVRANQNTAVYQWDTKQHEEGTYYVKVTAVDFAGNESSDLIMRRYEIDNTGIAKIRLSECTAGSTGILLTWEDVTEEDFEYFKVEELKDGSFAEIKRVSDALFVQIENLEPLSTHTYRVTGVDNLGNCGEPSEEITLTTSDDMTAPSITGINPVSSDYGDKINLSMTVKDNGSIAVGVFSYSIDGENFTELARISAKGENAENIYYLWDTSKVLEGEVIVRFEAYDAAGNHNMLYEEKQIENTYRIDHTPPEKVTGLSVTGEEGVIGLNWDQVSGNDIASYRIYRAVEGQNLFTCIDGNVKTIGYYDTNVKEKVTYIYQIEAVDKAGNVSEKSDRVYGTVRADDIAPEVTGIGPEGGILGSHARLEVLALDNAGLALVELEYRKADTADAWQAIESLPAAGREYYRKVSWDTKDLEEGCVYEVRARAKDRWGNISEYKYQRYTFDLTAPAPTLLHTESGSFRIELDYTQNTEEDFLHYQIYRKKYGEEDYTCIQESTETSFVDELEDTKSVYYYKIRAYDIYGNYSESNIEANHASFIDDIAPVAMLPETIDGMEGEGITFDGVLSTDNIRIGRYEWDFGDGTTAVGVRPEHVYEEEGNYTVSLTVSDAAGNKDTATTTVSVGNKTKNGTIKLQVTNKSGVGIPGAYVYVKTGDGDNDFKKLNCDSRGYVDIVGEAGYYEISAFAGGYLPGDSHFQLYANEKMPCNITLDRGELVTGTMTSKRLSIEEMIAKGVNLSDPGNYHTYEFQITLRFAESPYAIPIATTAVMDGNVKYLGHFGNDLHRVQAGIFPYKKTPAETEWEDSGEEIETALIYLETTQSIRWMKDMYEVSLGVVNNAGSGFTIHDASAALELPLGLSLARTASGEGVVYKMGSIAGKDSKKASWIVRGDASGTYQVAARFYGTMSPFEACVSARFTSNLECDVQTGEGLEIIVHPEDAYYPGEKYYIQFEVINKSGKPFYNVKTSFGRFEQAVPVFEWIVKDWNTKEIIEYERYEGMDYHITDISQKSVPVLYGGERLECGILPPGGRLYGTYCITAGGDEEKYYRYVDGFVKGLTGKNLGVRVAISSIESHVVKYLLYMDQKTKTLYGDPIDITSGAFLQDISSFSVDGSTSLLLGMHYNSTMASYKGECGYGWSHDYEQHIEDHGSFMNLYFGPYAWTTFVSREAGEHVVYGKILNDTVYIDSEAVYEDTFYPSSKALEGWSLLRTEEGYEVTSKDKDVYFFDKEGRLSGIKSQGGKSISIRYAEGQMILKDDVSGKQLYIFYNEEGMIERIADDSGREAVITYNGDDLVSFTNADGQKTAFVYDGSHHLIYGADANDIPYVENTYDEMGRVLTQKEGGSGTKAMLSYEETSDGELTVHVRNHNGESRSVTTNSKGEKIRETDEAGAITEYAYDDVGNLLTETDNEGNVVNYVYDEEGKLISYTNKAGEITGLSYDANGYVASVMEEDGTGTCFTYDEAGSLLREISPLGAVTRYAYDEKGNAVRQVVDGLGTITMTYEGGLLTGITDYNGGLTSFGYDEWGNRCLQTDSMGNSMEAVYDETGKILLEKGFDGTVTAYTYDAKGQKIEETVTGEDGKTRTVRYGYDGMGRVADVTNEAGTTAYTYDGEGNTTSITYPDGSRDTFVYDKTSNLIKAVTASGMITEYTYDSLGNKITEKTGDSLMSYEYDGEGRIRKIVQPTGEEIVYTYDKRGNCLTETDGRGNSYVYTYDAASNLTSSTDPLGNKTSYTYDIYGRCIKVTDPKGNSTAYAYDGNGNCIRQTNAAGTVTEMTYDARNRLIKTTEKTSEGENVTSFTYDKAGRVTAVTDGEGNTVHAAYDSFGNLTSLTDAEGNQLENNTYDSRGQLVLATDGLGNTTAYSYDRAGNITEIVECLNSEAETIKSYTYDADGRILACVDEEGGRTAQTYDAKGNVVAVSDPMGGTSTYSYDSMNRVTEIVNAIGVKDTYTYNAEGLLSESRNGKGEKTSYTYDEAGRISSRKDKEGTIRYTYDENGNVLTVTDKKGTISRTYDCLNRVTDVTDYQGNTISYGYDELGNRISITYPGGEKVRYSYDKAGNLLAVTDAQGGITRYAYDKNGRLILTERADGSREMRAYDGLGQLKILKDETKTGEVISDLAYEYDGRGNIVGISGIEAGLAGSVSDGEAKETASVLPVSIAMTYDADNRLLTYNGRSVEYDACGNMTKGPLNGGMAEFTYDCRNRLVKVKEEDGRTTVYEYDAEDIRAASVTGGVRTEYITDREAVYSQVLVKTSYGKNVFGVYNEERERITYTYGAGLINERRDGGEEYIYHYNHLGSAVAITDGNGEIVFRIVYGTYGELYDIRNAGGLSLLTAETAEGCTAAEVGYALGMEYLYNGQYGVSTGRNGLYYMRARYYNQDIKRFINRDILSGNIGNSQSLNRYCYVQGNPVSLTDPFGLCPTRAEVYKNRALKWLHTALDVGGILFDGFDYVNVLLYHFEGRDTEAAITLLCLLPVMGNFLAIPVRLTLKLGDNAGEALIKFGKKYLPDLMENGSRFLNWAGGKIDDVWRWIQKKLGRAGVEGGLDTIIKNGKVSIDDIKTNPSAFSGKSAEEIADVLRNSGYDVTIKNSTRSRSGAQIIQINNPGGGKNISQVQVSPGGGRHGSNPYVKISTTDQGIIKIVDGIENTYKTDGKETATIIFSGGN